MLSQPWKMCQLSVQCQATYHISKEMSKSEQVPCTVTYICPSLKKHIQFINYALVCCLYSYLFEGVGSPGTVVIDSSELLSGCWKFNPGPCPLKEHGVPNHWTISPGRVCSASKNSEGTCYPNRPSSIITLIWSLGIKSLHPNIRDARKTCTLTSLFSLKISPCRWIDSWWMN